MKPSRQIKPIGYPIAAIGKAADASPPSIHLALETTPLGTTSFRAAWAGLTTFHTPRNDTV